MPRSNRYLVAGYTYHLTHRCHNREHNLKSARERDLYKKWLKEGIRRFGVSVYAYAITRNHVHVLAHADNLESISGMMHLAAGSVAKNYNLYNGHLGSFWEHPFHCTLVDGRDHLMNCLAYIDLNMVRAGVVKHPSEWKWCSYNELIGTRKRYCILDIERLMETLEYNSLEQFRSVYKDLIYKKIGSDKLKRDPCWTEALAVGSKEFIKKAEILYPQRYCLYPENLAAEGSDVWCVYEEEDS